MKNVANGNKAGRGSHIFTRLAKGTSHAAGQPYAFASGVLLIVLWGLVGPLVHFNDTWQLVINTTTTIVTFLMVFLIQNTQNRDSAALHIKLDELIRSARGADKALLDLEELEEEDLETLRADYEKLAGSARAALARRQQSKRKRS